MQFCNSTIPHQSWQFSLITCNMIHFVPVTFLHSIKQTKHIMYISYFLQLSKPLLTTNNVVFIRS
jgi:hypothetical protein